MKAKDLATTMRCPYEVLGLEKTASDEDVRSAYKRLALRLHPDKNRDSQEAAEQFKEVVQAYSILSDPDKRRRYDLGGYEAFNEADLAVEIDLSALGTVNTAIAALFSKLGVPIRTAVAAGVLEAAYDGRFSASPLHFGQRVQDRVEKQAARFYELEVSQAQIDAGFVVTAFASAGSRFKLLLFEQQADNRWELVAQEDSTRMKKHAAAGLYCLPFDTYSVGPKLSSLETVNDPEAGLFKRLDSLKRREQVHVRSGKLAICVFGDNYFKAVKYCIEAALPGIATLSAEQVRQAEKELKRKQEELREFEVAYRRVQQQYAEVCARYEREVAEVERLLGQREEAYMQLLGVSGAAQDPLADVAAPAASWGPSGSGAQHAGAAGGLPPGGRHGGGGAAANGDVGAAEGSRLRGLGRLFSSSKKG